jgi:hypothetical protein
MRSVTTRPLLLTSHPWWRAGARIALCLVALACCGSSSAQIRDTGTTTAVVTPTLTVTLPSVAELRLDATVIVFDLGGSLQSTTIACVHGPASADLPAGTVSALDSQGAVFPQGTGFRPGTYPAITVEGAGPVAGYPPIRLDARGEALPRSDEDFVCYRSFLLRRFANVADWQLTIERPVHGGADQLEAVYVRAAGCGQSSELQGLFPVYLGERRLLGSAGASPACPEGEVGVLAVKTRAVSAGDTSAHLVYTLMAPVFESPP